jgi:putative methionine-R-sulfoxide reductase with GAF domain
MIPVPRELLQELQKVAQTAPTVASLMEQIAKRLHVVVQDVSKDSRYLSGSSLVKSKIVVPILMKRKLAAELDIESYFVDSFPKLEQEFVEACTNVVADYLARA